jgi:hypothetical protein
LSSDRGSDQEARRDDEGAEFRDRAGGRHRAPSLPREPAKNEGISRCGSEGPMVAHEHARFAQSTGLGFARPPAHGCGRLRVLSQRRGWLRNGRCSQHYRWHDDRRRRAVHWWHRGHGWYRSQHRRHHGWHGSQHRRHRDGRHRNGWRSDRRYGGWWWRSSRWRSSRWRGRSRFR